MALWFVTIAALGIYEVGMAPEILKAVNPLYGIRLFAAHGKQAFVLLGAVVDHAVDRGGLLLPGLAALDGGEDAVADDAGGDQDDDADERDGAPVAAAGDLDRGDRLAALAAALGTRAVPGWPVRAGLARGGLALPGRLADLDGGRDPFGPRRAHAHRASSIRIKRKGRGSGGRRTPKSTPDSMAE